MSTRFMYRLALAFFLLLVAFQTATSVWADTLTSVIKPTSALASRNFWQLNNALNIYQNATKSPWPTLPNDSRLLKVGMHSKAIPILRENLKITGDLPVDDDAGGRLFDSQLEDAVKVFQTRHGLKADGVVGETTREELNIPPELRVKQIAVNMQRWANLADKLGDRFVMVNIPDFHLYLVDAGRNVLSLRAIVGKKELPTPEITSRITQLEFNPYWNIPPKIAQRDIVPKMLDDSDYADKNHIRAFRVEGDDDSEVSPDNISWRRAADDGLNYHLRQDPGPDNALGQVKFIFPNDKDIYLHDTPAKNLFATDARDYSHGCVRLENPLALVSYLMKDNPEWDDVRTQEVLDSGDNKYIKVPNPIPIFITYITAWVDEDGRVNFRDDIYQLDGADAPGLAQDEPGLGG